MNVFIHTFSIAVNITWDELERLYDRYSWMPLDKSYKGENYNISIIEFCPNGLQMQVRERKETEIKYDKEHRPFRLDLVVTPYKLLHPNASLGAITDLDEMGEALFVLDGLLDKIEGETGIDIRSNYKIQRVDITCDVITPSDIYSKEIIAESKTAKLPYGYTRYEAAEETLEKYNWQIENASLYYNKNQGVFIKIYDKKENIKDKEEYADYAGKGLVRYEMTLARKNLKTYGFLSGDRLGGCMINIMQSREELFQKYFILNLYDLPMFSLKVLEDYLECKMAGKEKMLEKMKNFCKLAYKCKKSGIPFSAVQCGMGEERFRIYYKKFSQLNISPIPADNDCPYIPSIECMLNGEIEPKLAYFADKKTRGKEIWGYE